MIRCTRRWRHVSSAPEQRPRTSTLKVCKNVRASSLLLSLRRHVLSCPSVWPREINNQHEMFQLERTYLGNLDFFHHELLPVCFRLNQPGLSERAGTDHFLSGILIHVSLTFQITLCYLKQLLFLRKEAKVESSHVIMNHRHHLPYSSFVPASPSRRLLKEKETPYQWRRCWSNEPMGNIHEMSAAELGSRGTKEKIKNVEDTWHSCPYRCFACVSMIGYHG